MPPSRSVSRNRSRRRCTTSMRESARPARAESAAEEGVEHDRQQQAEQQAGDDRKIEVDVATVDGDVAGQFAEIGDPEAQREKEADHEDEAANDDEQLADLGHKFIVPALERPDLAAGARGGVKTIPPHPCPTLAVRRP